MTYNEQLKFERVKFWTAVWLGCDGSCTIEKAAEIADNALVGFDKRFVAEKTTTENSTDGDGWIVWSGGECPVPDNTNVHVKLRDGFVSKAVYTADQYRWSHSSIRDIYCSNASDIVAYKVVKEND